MSSPSHLKTGSERWEIIAPQLYPDTSEEIRLTGSDESSAFREP